jgi:uncharacterized protein
MGKIVFWLVVVFAVLFVVRLINAGKAARRRTDAGAAPGKPPRDGEATPMVRCSRCGVFLPKSDARLLPDGYHCGRAECTHRRPPG